VSIDFTPHAVYDIDTVAEYVEVARVGGGSRFRDDLAQRLGHLERFPETGELFEPPNRRYPSLRVGRLKRFRRYAVYYLPAEGGILVVRVLHTSRNIAVIFSPDPDVLTPPCS
jgi:plasmid stabilization system protein ParE